jgi:gas vesicle structural protein
MAVERVPGSSSLIDVLDRILDKGIVVDAWVRISLVGIDLISQDARVIVASNDTYLSYDGSFAAGKLAAHAVPADGVSQDRSTQVGTRAMRRRR